MNTRGEAARCGHGQAGTQRRAARPVITPQARRSAGRGGANANRNACSEPQTSVGFWQAEPVWLQRPQFLEPAIDALETFIPGGAEEIPGPRRLVRDQPRPAFEG